MDLEPEEDIGLIVYFDVSPEGFPWQAEVVKAIEKRRAQMADVLIFDILLSLGGIKHPDALYPPRDVSVLERLLNAIEDSTYDALKKDGIVYFLLKWHRDGREVYYAQSRCIPPQFVALADAYWCLDSGEDVPRAVSLLADARLNRDYTSKIIQAISHDADPHPLILRYIRTAKPLLTEPDDIDAYSIALAESSLLEAWQYQRTYPEDSDARARLIRNILTWSLTPKPRAKPLTQLLAFPLSIYEQLQLHHYALHPPQDLPASATHIIQDLACVRLVQSGQYVAAVKLDRQFSINPIRGKVTETVRRVIKDRRQTIEEIMAVLPLIERQLLEEELAKMAQSPGDASAFLNGSAMDISMSWENVRSPKPKTTVAASPAKQKEKQREAIPQPVFESPIRPIPQRSGAPRFGGASPSSVPTGASTSFSAVREMFDTMTKPSPQPLAAVPTEPVLSSRNAGSSMQMASAGPSSASRRKEQTSLFESVGSANRSANAFFHPTSTTVGVKRPREDFLSPPRRSPPRGDTSMGSVMDVSAMLDAPAEEEEEEAGDGGDEREEGEEQDIEMHEADFTLPHIEDVVPQERGQEREQDHDLSEAEEFSFSLFTPLADSGRPPQAKETTVRPPGSFLAPDSEEDSDQHDHEHEQEREQEHEPEREQEGTMREDELQTPEKKRGGRSTRSRSRSQPPQQQQSQQQQRKPTRMTRTRSAQVEAQLMRSIPGAFMDEIDEEEEEDVVPPLPTLTSASTSTKNASTAPRASRLPRRTRSTRASDETKTPRRSTRLSAVSAGSSSPEPVSVSVSPERVSKGRKSTARAPAAATTTRTPRTRKHR